MIAGYGRMTPGDGVKYGNEFFYGLQPPCCAVKDEHCEIRGVKESKLRGLDAGALEVWPGNEPGGRRARSGRDRRRRRISYARRTGGRPDACWREGRGWWVDGTVRIASEASRCARAGGVRPRESRAESSSFLVVCRKSRDARPELFWVGEPRIGFSRLGPARRAGTSPSRACAFLSAFGRTQRRAPRARPPLRARLRHESRMSALTMRSAVAAASAATAGARVGAPGIVERRKVFAAVASTARSPGRGARRLGRRRRSSHPGSPPRT